MRCLYAVERLHTSSSDTVSVSFFSKPFIISSYNLLYELFAVPLPIDNGSDTGGKRMDDGGKRRDRYINTITDKSAVGNIYVYFLTV